MTHQLEKLAIAVGQALNIQHLKLATAESCTGGGLSYWITHVPGSSAWFERGFVTYSDAAKSEMLGVNPQTIATFGAVSKETAIEMATGALQKSKADISIAITGIAGPNGGSQDKPVGTVWIAIAKRKYPTDAQSILFAGDRQLVRERTIVCALEKLLEKLK